MRPRFERPEQFAGRSLDDIKPAELAAIRRGIQQRTLSNFAGPLHAPDHWWQDDLKLEKGAQAWLIVDPPDGKIPALTSEGQQRAAARAEARRAVVSWMIDAGPPNPLLKRGWNKNSLPAGTEIVVEGYQAKDGAQRANGRDITFPDGKKLFVGSSGTGAPDERPEK